MITRLQHLGVVVKDLGAVCQMFEELFGLRCQDIRSTESGGKMLDARIMLGDDCWIHLMQNWNPESRYYKMLEKAGKTVLLEHLCFESDDIEADVEHLKNCGAKAYNDKIYDARDGYEVFFLPDQNPTGDLLGVTVELIQPHPTSRGYHGPISEEEIEKKQAGAHGEHS